jgi:hypothetical protein
MSSLPEMRGRVWAALGPDRLLDALGPLVRAHGRSRSIALLSGDAHEVERVASVLGDRPATLLVLENPEQASVRERLGSLFLSRNRGPDVIVGWLRMSACDLAVYAQRAAALLQRTAVSDRTPLVLLGPREQRYSELLDEIEATLSDFPTVQSLRWSAERIRREPLARALRVGAGAVLYAGHGNASGWFAYRGVSARTLAADGAWSHTETSALMFSLSCSAARTAPQPMGDPATRVSFADALVANGIAGAVLASISDPLHADNRVLAHALVRALGSDHRGLDEILWSVRSESAPIAGYTVIGDPALRAVAAPDAGALGARVFAPHPRHLMCTPLAAKLYHRQKGNAVFAHTP